VSDHVGRPGVNQHEVVRGNPSPAGTAEAVPCEDRVWRRVERIVTGRFRDAFFECRWTVGRLRSLIGVAKAAPLLPVRPTFPPARPAAPAPKRVAIVALGRGRRGNRPPSAAVLY
jgi:hypothetical protein